MSSTPAPRLWLFTYDVRKGVDKKSRPRGAFEHFTTGKTNSGNFFRKHAADERVALANVAMAAANRIRKGREPERS